MRFISIRLTKQAQVATSVIAILALSLGFIGTATAQAPKLFTMTVSKGMMNVLSPKPIIEVLKVDTQPLTETQLVELLYTTGFRGKNLKTAWAIAMRESHGNPLAHNGNSHTGDNSYGLFQINMINSLGIDRRAKYNLTSNEDLYNPVLNASIVYSMTNGGEDWGAWDIGSGAYNHRNNEPAYLEWLTMYPTDYQIGSSQ